jgi:hypothetical protein
VRRHGKYVHDHTVAVRAEQWQRVERVATVEVDGAVAVAFAVTSEAVGAIAASAATLAFARASAAAAAATPAHTDWQRFVL